MKRVLNHPAADAELVAEATYLEQQLPGCGALFLASVATLREKMAEFPEMFPERMPGIRFCTMPVFRYVIPYHVRGDEIIILAYAHTSRRPGYWCDRLSTV